MVKHSKVKRIRHSNAPVQYALTKCYSSIGGRVNQAPDHSFCDFNCTLDELFFLEKCYKILETEYSRLRTRYDVDNEFLPTSFIEYFRHGFNCDPEPKTKDLHSRCYKLGKAFMVSCKRFQEEEQRQYKKT